MDKKELKILLVEDSPIAARLYQRILQGQKEIKVKARSADSLASALENLAAEAPDVIIADLGLPDADGLDAFRKLRASNPLVPIIVLTGTEDSETAIAALREGAQDYLVKTDVTPALLTRSVRYALERHRIETAVLLEKRHWELTFDAMQDLIAIVDSNYRIVKVNKRLTERLRKSPEELIGSVCHKHFHGTSNPPSTCPHLRVLEEGVSYSYETEWAAGVFHVTITPLRGADGSLLGSVHVARDISASKQAEKLLLQTERVRAIGELAGGVAHNFNNLLQGVMAVAHVAQTDIKYGDYDEAVTSLQRILKSCRMGAEMVRRLRDFARIGEDNDLSSAEVFDLSQVVEQAIEMSKPFWKTKPQSAGVGVSLARDLADDCFVLGKENELFEVAVNLIKNASEAFVEGGDILIRTRRDGDRVLLDVRDTGVGIAQEDLVRVFDPFWTTKGLQGTGMGLASSYGIVQAMGGRLTVESAPGKGATFTVDLPYAEKAPSTAAEYAKPVAKERLNILIIDDVETTLKLLSQGLTRYGHSVECAPSGEEGLRAHERFQADAVICDLAMPGLSGWDVAKSIKTWCAERGRPKTPFILLTGWAGHKFEDDLVRGSGVDLILEKPIEIQKLLQEIEDLLERLRSRTARA